jgi:diguanylate cyclase
MARITPINSGVLEQHARLSMPLTLRDVLFVVGVAAASVGGSVGMTLLQIGPEPSALSTAVLIPFIVSVPVATYLTRQRSRITALNAQLNELVRRDALTGLLNRRAFVAGVEGAGPGALILIDADRFKAVNDTYGHPAGDSVLADIASRLGHVAGPAALTGRLGGEEFAVFAPGLSLSQGADLAQALRAAVATRSVSHVGLAIPCTISLGLAMIGPGVTLTQAMAAADAALYAAKAQGRDRVVLAGQAAPPLLGRNAAAG